MRTLLLFRGAPGCGKSTYIKEHNLEQYVLSADTLRFMCQSAQETPAGQMEISPQNDDVVWEMLFKLLEVRMSHGEFTVIDATNSKTVEMNRYKNLAKQYRYRMYVIDMTDLPIEECKRRNAQREWLKRVPEAAIDKMYARFATQKVPSGVTVLPSTTDVMSNLNYCPNDFNQWKKIHVIGDVHGCYTCLSEYLGEMKGDELYIFVGDYLDHGFEHVEGFVLRDSNNFMFKMKLPYYKHWKFLRGVMQSVQKRGYYENTAKLFTAEDNLFYGWMREQREKDQESFCKKGIIQLRNEFYASQQKS